MTAALATRSAVAIVSIALALGLAAPAASATGLDHSPSDPAPGPGTSSVLPATNRIGPGDPSHSPATQATPDICDPFGPRLEICAGAGSYGVLDAPHPPSTRTTAPAATHVSEFDWGDAAIGAGATMVLVGIGLGGLRAATNNRSRHATAR